MTATDAVQLRPRLRPARAHPRAHRDVEPLGPLRTVGGAAPGDRREPQRDQRRHHRPAGGLGGRRAQPGRRDRQGARLHRAGVRREPRTRRRSLGQRGAVAVADREARGAHAPPPRRPRRDRRGGRGAPLRLRRGRRAARCDPGVLRAPELVGRPQLDPPEPGRRHLPVRAREAAAQLSRGAVRRPQRRPGERRDPHAHRTRRVARAAGRVPRRVGGRRQRRARASPGRTTTRSRRPASTSTGASTT